MKQKSEKPDVKALIITAAEEEFLSVGYAGARMMNIAKNAGVTHAMLHYYFRSKDNLFEVIFKEKAGAFFGNFTPILESDCSFLEKIPRLIKAHLDFVTKNPRMPLFLLYETSKNPGLIRDTLSGNKHNPIAIFYQLFEKETKKAIRKKEIKKIDPLELMLTIFSLNIFPLLAQPLITNVGILPDNTFRQLMKRRSQEVSKFIIAGLKNT